jgi:nitrogen-specific signal transduction histidine kinase/CheY-like chemotaxis protein
MFDGISSQLGQFIDRKQIERQFQQSQKMEAFGQLAGGVAHDFNNLLAVIMGYASLLSDEELPAGAKNLVGHIYTAGEKAANLTRQLLTFSRKKEIKLSPLNLNSVIANVTKMLGRIIGEDVRLHCSYSPNLPSIQGDDGMMEQVLMNLAVNARDAMPKGGELTISTAVQTLSPDDLPAIPEVQPGDFVRLTVRDNGCGMSPEIKERIFEPFFTTKEVGKGTGLGLATVFGIVKEHQGWVEVESEVGAGAAFKLFFPVYSQPVAAADSRPAYAVRPGNETILVVEDDHAVREMTKRILARHGYHVLEATSGTQAIAVWEKHKHQIRLLLTDIIMPGGIAGPELARELKSRDPKLKVIYSSGYSAYSPSTLEQGDDAIFIQKPFDPRQLAESVRRSLDSWK